MKPIILFLRVLGIVAVVEFWVMAVLWYLDLPAGPTQFFIDSLLLSLASAPFLYLWVVRPEVKGLESEVQSAIEDQAIRNKVLRLSLEDIPLEEVLGRIIDQIFSVKRLNLKSMGGIWLVEEPGELVLMAHRGLPPELQNICSNGSSNECACGHTALSGEIEFHSYLDERHERDYEGTMPQGYYCIPMKYSGKVIGVINLYPIKGHRKDKREEEFLLSMADITAGIVCRKQAEKALLESEEKLQKISHSAQDAIIMIDNDGKISFWNPASEKIFGYTSEETLGQDCHLFLTPGRYYEAFKKGFDKFQSTGMGPVIGKTLELAAVRKDGTEFPIELSTSAVIIGGKWNSIGIIRDITERKRSEEMIHHMAYYDHLTGLPNRILLMDRLNQVIALGHRHRLYAAVLFLDLDRFKYINDTLGHAVGDELLKSVAERLKSRLRITDTIARLGGDEFIIILQDIKKREDVAKVVEKLLSILNVPFITKGHECYITISIGISIFPDDGKDAETLLKKADIAMYQAKNDGAGNSYHLYTPAELLQS